MRGHNGGPDINEPVVVVREGWVAVSRGMRSHWLVGFGQPVKAQDPSRGSYSRAEAWIDLIMECQWRPGYVINGGRKMAIRPGELVGATSWLASRWNWTPWTVRVFLDKLEGDQMIARATPGVAETESQDTPKCREQKGKQAQIISVCNYLSYQVSDYALPQANSQADREQTASKPQADRNIYKEEQGNKETIDSPPTPRRRGARPPKAELTQEQIAISDQAIEVYNAEAKRLGIVACHAADTARRKRLVERVKGIGGIEQFRVACSAIQHVPFLIGKVPPRPGDQPFRLDLDRLMQTEGALGNVLAKLIDKAAEVTAPKRPSSIGELAAEIAQLSDEQQGELLDAHANGIWPKARLTYSPAEDRCPFRPHVLASRGITPTTYDEKGFRRS